MNQKHISYGILSDLTGIHKSSLHRYITGTIENIPLEKLESIAHALGTTPQHLLGWEEVFEEEENKIASAVELVNKTYIVDTIRLIRMAGSLNDEGLKKLEEYADYLKTKDEYKDDFVKIMEE